MKKLFVGLLPVIALLLVSSLASRADEFSQIEHSPGTYWVPPSAGPVVNGGYYGPGYYAGPPPPAYYGYYGPAYYGPPRGYYYGPRHRAYYGGPSVIFGFNIH